MPPTPQNRVYNSTGEGCGSSLCVFGEKLLLTEKLNWIQDKDITPKQRFLVEQVSWGRKTQEELEEFFADTPKNLKYKVINPLVNQGILLETDEGYRVNVEAVHRAFVESGGEKLLHKEIEAVDEERAKHRLNLEQRGKEYDPEAIHDWEAESEKRIEAVLRGDLPFDDLTDWEQWQFFTRLQEKQLKTTSRKGSPVLTESDHSGDL